MKQIFILGYICLNQNIFRSIYHCKSLLPHPKIYNLLLNFEKSTRKLSALHAVIATKSFCLIQNMWPNMYVSSKEELALSDHHSVQ